MQQIVAGRHRRVQQSSIYGAYSSVGKMSAFEGIHESGGGYRIGGREERDFRQARVSKVRRSNCGGDQKLAERIRRKE